MKNKANECKMLKSTSLGNSITVKVPLTVMKFEKTMCENFDFVHFLSFFLSFFVAFFLSLIN